MSNIKLGWLADELNDAGLNVEEHQGWETRSSPTVNEYTPVGLLNHHTAGSSILYNYPNPPYWTNTRLENLCNITIRPDGVVAVLNAGYAYDSGQGDPDVLDRVVNDLPVQPAADHDPSDRILGNPYFIDIEVQHRGNGDPIEPVQREALITTNAVICNHMGWNPETRLLGHREWTVRKTDPKWDGTTNPMPQIRLDTLEEMMPSVEEIAQAVWEHNVQSGITAALALDRNYRNISELIVAHRAGTLGTTALADIDVDDLQDIADAVADELASRLQ